MFVEMMIIMVNHIDDNDMDRWLEMTDNRCRDRNVANVDFIIWIGRHLLLLRLSSIVVDNGHQKTIDRMMMMKNLAEWKQNINGKKVEWTRG